MKTGTGQFAPFQWTIESLFDMRSSLFKMSDGKKQKSTKLYQNFCCSACGKEMPRHFGLGNRCTSTSCHSVTMTILAMHLIGTGNKLEGDVSDVIALDLLTSPFSPRKATKMSP